MYYNIQKIWVQKKFAEGLVWLSGKVIFVEGLSHSSWQRIFFFEKKIKIFAKRAIFFAESQTFGGWPSAKRAFADCLRSSPRQS